PQLFVNTATISLYYRSVDLLYGGPAPALVFERSYNLDDNRGSPWGNRWSSSLGDSLTQDPDKSWLLRRGSGRSDRFVLTADGHVSSVSDSAGRSLQFTYDDQGNLTQQTNADGQTITYQYDGGGNLTAILTPAGQTQIGYNGDFDFPAVSSITLPDGSTRQYA